LPEKRPKLTTDIPYEELRVDSIAADVSRAISKNPNVWAALQAVIIEREDLRMTLKPYEVEKLEIEIAELTAAEAQRTLEKQLPLLYYDILTLQESIGASEKAVAAAEQAVTTAKLKLEVGMATQGDVLSAQADLETAKKNLAELKYRHAAALAAYCNLTGRDPLPVVDK